MTLTAIQLFKDPKRKIHIYSEFVGKALKLKLRA